MRSGANLLLIAAGAILIWTVSTSVSGIDTQIVGIILLVVGIVGVVLSLISWSSWGGFGDRRETTVIER
jgi:hypothetical protein